MPNTKPTSEQVTFLASGTGAVQRTALTKFRDTVSVKDFGAVGDGVADDTAVIQACYTANQGKEISHGDGFTYLISTGLTLYSGSKYVGKSVIKQKNAAAIAGPMMTGTSVSNCVVQDIEINGNAANNAAALTFGIKFIGGTNNLVNNCNVHDTTQAGIYFASESYSKVIDNHVINCGRNLGTDDHGIMLISNTSTPLTSIVCQGNTVTGANRKGITVYNATPGVVQGVTIENNIVTGCILGGIYVSNAGAVTHGYFNGIAIVGNRCYNNYVNIEADAIKSGVVSGNTCDTTTGGAGMYLSDCLYSTVSANSITNSQADGIKIIGTTVTSTGMIVSGNSISLSSQSGTGTYSGINFNGVTYSSVVGNVILGESSSPKQKYGIEETGSSDYNLFSSNRIANMSTSISLSAVGNNNVFQSTIGKLTALNTATPLNTLDINGGLSLRDQSITLANGANNNVTLPANAGTLYVSGPTGAYSIQGIAGGSQGKKLTIVNYTTQTMTVNYNDAGATAGNKILIGGLANLAITQYGSVDLIYINGASAWFVTGLKA